MSRSKRNGVWVDEGPASARITAHIGEGKTSLIRGLPDPDFERSEGAGRIERRQATEAQIEAFGGRARPDMTPGTDATEPDADEEDEEDPSMNEPIPDQPDTTTAIRQLVTAANIADEAWDAWRAADVAMAHADERWELARRDLRRAWEAAKDHVAADPPDHLPAQEIELAGGAIMRVHSDGQPGTLEALRELGEAIAAELPGVDEVLAGEVVEPEPVSDPGADHSETIPVPEPERDEALLERARALSPVDRLEARPPKAAAGGGPTLGRQQRRILDSSIRNRGDRKAVARDLGTTENNVQATLHDLGKKGLLPLDLIQQLPAGYAKYASVP